MSIDRMIEGDSAYHKAIISHAFKRTEDREHTG